MRSHLKRHAARRALAAVMLLSGFTVAACDGGSAFAPAGSAAALSRGEVGILLEALRGAPDHGFQPGAFGETRLAEHVHDGGAEGREQLRQAVLAYARALHGHAIPARSYEADWGLKPAAYDVEAEFRKAEEAGRLSEWVASLAPTSSQYRRLRDGYAAYRKIAMAGGWRPLPAAPDLRAGGRGPAVAALRARLAAEDATAAEAGVGDVFDSALTAAVLRAQQRYGLNPTGVVDAETRAALNVPVAARLAQMRANLERLRWLPRAGPATRIEVNSAAGVVDVYRDGENVMSMLAAAGKPGDETPILVSTVETLVFNPTWNVPNGIAQEELLPKGSAYLDRMGFVRDPEGTDLLLMQKPGPQNALGRVKFLFDNPYSVYLHDTPSRAAFERAQRSVSHGCVRLAQAVELARLLAAGEAGWSAERVDEVLAGGETTELKLAKPVPVYLLYMTAYAAQNGAIAFRSDPYGWDEKVLRRLDAAHPGSA